MHQPNRPDWGDFLKTSAVICVMLQTVLSFLMKTAPSNNAQSIIADIYAGAKFTAPAFISGILYTTVRILPQNNLQSYHRYMADQWHALYLPTILWTIAYLIVYPQLQQRNPYHSLGGFLVKIINGNAAPHLWYSTMMLQFIALMPIFWALSHWMGASASRGYVALLSTLIFEAGWFGFYDKLIYHGPAASSLYWFDRIFPSFLIYAVLGVSMWVYHKSCSRFIPRLLPIIIIFWLCLWNFCGRRLQQSGTTIHFSNLPYYHPLVMIYNLLGVLMICGFGELFIRSHSVIAKAAHWIAVYAFRAFLSHAFWLETIWLILGKRVFHMRVSLLIIILYLGTIILSFLSAYLFHVLRLLITKRHLLFQK